MNEWFGFELTGALGSALYMQTGLIVLGLLFVSSLVVYPLRKTNHYFTVSWASVKSWLFVAPLFFILFGLPQPWPLLVLVFLSFIGAKTFFQLMGMYHRSYFVLICYLGIALLGLSFYQDLPDLYNLTPMVVLAGSLLVPLVRNNYKYMIQYIALTNLGFVFIGWSFLHLGKILTLPEGIFHLAYIVILTEFCDNTNQATARAVGRTKIFSRIDSKRTLESTVLAAALTLVLAFLMRYLLPEESGSYWWIAGIVASVGGLFGDLVMTVIRRDAGIKVVGMFILGRGDYLDRMDRLIFVAPIYFYIMTLFLT